MMVAVYSTIVCAVTLVLYAIALGARRLPGRPLAASASVILTGYAVLLVTRPPSLALSNAAVLLAGAAAGLLLGALLSSLGAIVTFSIAAAAADLASYFAGATASLLSAFRAGSSDLLVYLSITVPVDGRLRPVLGVGDLLILAALFSSFLGLGLRDWTLLALPLLALLVALVVGVWLGGVPGVPFLAASALVLAARVREPSF